MSLGASEPPAILAGLVKTGYIPLPTHIDIYLLPIYIVGNYRSQQEDLKKKKQERSVHVLHQPDDWSYFSGNRGFFLFTEIAKYLHPQFFFRVILRPKNSHTS